ncbi:ATP--cob(I)alamin adenosyltransferase [Oceanisphaera sp. KMM 10153]|uniref:ATP--cob(I)alamin adenosyltransferase n=1 Tax=Oceanisphaera submarina TaxID=3390193 RepID=UPI00397471D5
MRRKKPEDLREWCYPFIFETRLTCDYEILTDELCCHIGVVLSQLGEGFDDIRADLERLQPLIYNLNGSVRGKNGIFEQDIDWLKQRYTYYQQASEGRVTGFVLPRGPAPVPQLHLCRCTGKKIVRMLVRLEEEGRKFDELLPRFANVLANFFFVLTVAIKDRLGTEEVPYISINY